MGTQGKTLTDEVKNDILKKFKEGKLVSQIVKENDLSRSEIKDVIEDYLNAKLISEDKVV
ncbi:hypothetical protein [Clostridium pasteurianum]|uniref:Uncharacterized protein n=1 Tax=Clostridium pasteurianum BC1 TaxID=86416 RepID=R4K4N3_CLOPA|nr:hypothetical protein [Clostridium pasteurianum]AGK98117.1 hypothetical protein Clopa_3320 [Clostridium pasteurianum BC1]